MMDADKYDIAHDLYDKSEEMPQFNRLIISIFLPKHNCKGSHRKRVKKKFSNMQLYRVFQNGFAGLDQDGTTCIEEYFIHKLLVYPSIIIYLN